MIKRRDVFLATLSVWLVLCVSGLAIAASLEAVVDRSTVDFGQSVNLTVTATGINGEIDFAVLEDDFEILDTRRSRNVRIVNGQSDSSVVWQIGLMPLKAGEVKIPPFTLDGVQSAQLTLSVKEASQTQQMDPAGQDFFLEITTDKTEAFVQEQIILTARVYQARNIIEGSLSDPLGDGLLLQRLGNDQTFSTTLDGREYKVIERRYVIFAQTSGEHTISPLRLVATVRQNNRSGSNSGFFTPTQKVRVASNSLVLSVNPKPTGGQSGWWLPAETLSLTADWNEDISQARVDEPITRNINLAAKAVLSTQLPPLDVPEIKDAKIYPDQPDIQTQTVGDSLITYRVDKWAIIPRAVGPLTIPEIRLEWYDTINDKLQYAILPAQVIDIKAAENTNTSANNVVKPVETDEGLQSAPADVVVEENLKSTTTASVKVDDSAFRWQLAFYIILLLWLMTLGIWFWQQKIKKLASKSKPMMPDSVIGNSASLRGVEEGCRSGDAKMIVQSLLSFAKKQWPDNPPHSIGELSARLNYKPLTSLLSALDIAVYAKSAGNSNFSELSATLKSALGASKQSKTQPSHEKSLLPEL